MVAHRGARAHLALVIFAGALLAGCGRAPAAAGPDGRTPSPGVPVSAQPAGLPSLPPPHTPTGLLAVTPIGAPSGAPTGPPTGSASSPPSGAPTAAPTETPWVPGPLIAPGLDLRAGPVPVALELQIPSLQVKANVMSVGITALNAMDAPKGPIGDGIWQAAFWYRGSGVPGASGTATFAGHVDDPLGRPAVFARLTDLHPGAVILIHDPRSGRDIQFTVTQTQDYSTQQASDPAVLALIYGAGPVAGQGPQPAPDGRAHLSLITCAGDIVNGAFDHHVVVFATRTD